MYLLFLTLATQYNIGVDYYAYQQIFRSHYLIEELEIGFRGLCKTLKLFTSNEQIIFVGVSLIQVILLTYIVKLLKDKKIIKNISLFILIFFITTDNFLMLFNALRSSIASLCFTIAILKFLEKKINIGIIFILLGSTFHKSIFLIFLFIVIGYWLFKIKYNKIFYIVLILFSFIVNKLEVLNIIFIKIYQSSLNIPYKHYLVSEHMISSRVSGLGLTVVFNLIFVIFSIILLSKNNKDREYYILLNIGYFTLALKFLFLGIPILNRIFEYFGVFQALIYYNMIEKLRGTRGKVKLITLSISNVIIIYYIMQLFIGTYRTLNANGIDLSQTNIFFK